MAKGGRDCLLILLNDYPKFATALPDLADRWLTKAALSVAIRRGRSADALSPSNPPRVNRIHCLNF